MKYIFLAGAPGSKWSSVSGDLRNFNGINTTDSLKERSYVKPNEISPMHAGAYWDPGMEFGEGFDSFNEQAVDELERQFDMPFQLINNRPRIIKSHQFCKFLNDITNNRKWICDPLVLVSRSEEDARTWWYEAGGWDISYPDYSWYKNKMDHEIHVQTKMINEFINTNVTCKVNNVLELANALGMTVDKKYNREFVEMDVYVYWHPRMTYFKDTWSSKIEQYQYSGINATISRIGTNETVLDIGCGNNFFKTALGDRVTGIDPANKNSDYRTSIDEYIIQEQFDHVICYGSINFGNRDEIEQQVCKVVECAKKNGKIHWRLNPGLYDHGLVGQENLELFKWTKEIVFEMATKNGCTVEIIEQDINRLFSLWTK